MAFSCLQHSDKAYQLQMLLEQQIQYLVTVVTSQVLLSLGKMTFVKPIAQSYGPCMMADLICCQKSCGATVWLPLLVMKPMVETASYSPRVPKPSKRHNGAGRSAWVVHKQFECSLGQGGGGKEKIEFQ